MKETFSSPSLDSWLPWVLLGLWAQPGAKAPARGRQPPSSVPGTGLCGFFRAWSAGGGGDKTPWLRWGRGRERGQREGTKGTDMLARRERRLERGGVGVLWVGDGALGWEKDSRG